MKRSSKILLIEDNPDDVIIVEDALKEGGGRATLSLETADCLSTGLKILERGDIDAVILDLKLPDSTGETTILKTRAAAPAVPIVVLTGTDDEGMAVESIQKGTHDYLVKGKVDGPGLVRALHFAMVRQRCQIEMEQIRILERMVDLGRLAAGVANEINNAVSGVVGMAELLRRGQGRGNELEIVIQEGHRISQIARNLIQYTRPDAPATGDIDVAEFIAKTLDMARPHLMLHRIKLETSVAKDLPAIQINELHAQQILLNLILNGCDAMPDGGQIEIEAGRRNEFVRFVISDSGPGIPEDLLPKIFDPFYSTKPRIPSFGLGLSVVAGLVRSCGGRIRAANRPEGGAVFTVHLPIGPVPATPLRSKPRVLDAAPSHLSILVVDDEPHVRDVCKRYLERIGNRVVEAGGVAEAMQCLLAEPFDVVLCDRYLQDQDGLVLYETLKERGRLEATRFVLMSGVSSDEPELAFPRLTKPFSFEELGHVIRRVGSGAARGRNKFDSPRAAR